MVWSRFGRVLGIGLAVGFAWTGPGHATVLTVGGAGTGCEFEVTEGGAEELVVSVSEVRLEALEIEGASWAVVRVPSGHNSMERGRPSLPYLATEYLLGAGDGISLELIDVVVQEIDLTEHGLVGVAPSKGHFNRDVDPETIPWVFDDRVYAGSQAYPRLDAVVDEPFIAGPLRGQAVRVPVVRWQPSSNLLTVVERARFRVVLAGDAANPRTGRQPPMTGLFEQIARQRAVNYDAVRSRYIPLVEAGRLLVLADDDFVDEVEPLADWHRQVGYPTVVTPVSAAGGTATQIMAYIQSLYDAPDGLTWIILVGDYQQIPNFNGVNESASCDPCYTKLEGADNRPDAAISRISAGNGADVTIQVNKILDYERYPDVGSAATWYSAGFGIAGDDTGGTGLADWQRMDLLRDDLMEPAYTYTEFDQIYHSSASASQVTSAVNAGRSLGLYIGHGSTSAWSTTGFNSGNVHALTNGEMLPVIWSVACLNGRFHDVTECFAEAWLREDAGGAVSFEGATTNESWVPPCNAQRGIIDALRQEVAFTTGGQHVNGKLYCMDTDGDSNGSEGTKFMEQSTLFGSCLTWPRTDEPVIPDEPDDFQSAGGFATLTVKVGGAPYAKAGGAIVSFYTKAGSAINVLGSGHINDQGVVSAPVDGDPTHCHIHGSNLVPQEYELAARPDGSVSLDGTAYPCDGVVGIRVSDSNVAGSGPTTVDTVDVTLDGGGSSTTVTLTEVAADKNLYLGGASLGTDLVVAHGDLVTVTYIDEDDGHGGVNLARTDSATVDCAAPLISGITATATQSTLTVSFTTDEPGTTVLMYGTSAPPTEVFSDQELVTDHAITVAELQPCTLYFFAVASADAQSNTGVDDDSGHFYRVATDGWEAFLTTTFDTDPGWAIDNGNHPGQGWAFGQPTGQGQDSYGGPDPTSGYTGPNVYGVNLAGDMPANLVMDELKLTTPTLDLSRAESAQVRFRRWLGVEEDVYDHARIRLSTDGGTSWATVWENDSTNIDDQAWVEAVVPLPGAEGSSAVQIQWTMGPTDSAWNFCGWNLDDVVVEGKVACDAASRIFSDGFEVGSCAAWATVVGEE